MTFVPNRPLRVPLLGEGIFPAVVPLPANLSATPSEGNIMGAKLDAKRQLKIVRVKETARTRRALIQVLPSIAHAVACFVARLAPLFFR